MAASADATELIASIRDAGGTVRADGDMIELAAPVPLPPDLVARIREAKPAILAALSPAGGVVGLSEAAWWRREFTIRALDRVIGDRPEHTAERLAFNDLVLEWHLRHGQRIPTSRCAGCGEPIGNFASLNLQDGNRVHFDYQTACLIAYGKRWRGAARRALRAMGFELPADEDDL